MKKGLMFIFSLLSIGLCMAQVGVNTKNPQGVLHIDGKGNTNGSVNTIDDFVVDANGNVGISTVSPQTKLDVMGSMLVAGGSPSADKVLTSNSQGVASWKDFDRSKGIATWTITATGVTFPTSTMVVIKGTQTLSDPNGMGFTAFASTTSSAITVPAGTFLIVADFDVNVIEYGQVGIFKYGTSEYLYQVYYFEQLNGGSTIYNFSAPTTIELKSAYRNLSTSGITRYTVPPFNNATVASTIRFISLTK